MSQSFDRKVSEISSPQSVIAVDFYIYPHLPSLFLIQSTTQDL